MQVFSLGFSALSGTRSASTSDPMASVSSGLSIGSADIVAGWGLPSSQAAETQRHPAERELKGEGIPGIPKYWSDLALALPPSSRAHVFTPRLPLVAGWRRGVWWWWWWLTAGGGGGDGASAVAGGHTVAGVVVVTPLMVRRHKSMSYHTPLARPRHCTRAARAASAAPANCDHHRPHCLCAVPRPMRCGAEASGAQGGDQKGGGTASGGGASER